MSIIIRLVCNLVCNSYTQDNLWESVETKAMPCKPANCTVGETHPIFYSTPSTAVGYNSPFFDIPIFSLRNQPEFQNLYDPNTVS